ncbi:PIN domain-containing protein [Halomarina litorea]|uniref:PIN domain-containing protein n=1 Tax=Halomarina litorea TaxID=2961595 RepID=UPI0020C401D3|nr:PIN domain-containing protein [Halomarina sp. BCD28]
MILDTSFLIDLFRGQDAAFQKGSELVAAGAVQRVPAPVVAELAYGVEMEGTNAERRKFDNAMAMYPVVTQTRELARLSGELLAKADRTDGGESGIDPIDPMIAAVSVVVGEPVLTDNVDHFKQLGVDVETY